MSDVQQRPRSRPPELALRAVSGIVLIVIALALTWYGGLPFGILCAGAAMLMLVEYLHISGGALPSGMRPVAYGMLGLVLVSWFVYGAAAALAVATVSLVVLLGWEMAGRRSVWGASGLAYAVLPFGALVLLRADNTTGLHVVLLLFGCVWGTDTAAYFCGRMIGGPKLAPAISPNKTWAGFFGGITGAVVVSALVLHFTGYRPKSTAVMLVVALSVVSQLGDLFESWIKRHFKVKDSGAIIPGHGGILDRVDGLVFAAISAWLAGSVLGGGPLTPGRAGEALYTAFVLP